MISPSPVSLDSKNFLVKESFYETSKFMKLLKNFRFILDMINPCKFAIIINKTHIIFLSTNRFRCRTTYIRKNKLKRETRYTSRSRI